MRTGNRLKGEEENRRKGEEEKERVKRGGRGKERRGKGREFTEFIEYRVQLTCR